MTQKIKRRSFLKQAGISASALAIGAYLNGCQWEAPEPEGIIQLFKPNIDEIAEGIGLNPYLFINPSGLVTIFAHKPDMGQGTFQSIPMLIAEELDVDFENIQIKIPPANNEFQEQSVGGSSSVRTMWEPMRKVGAAAREMLVQAAAKQWGVTTADCRTENGTVIRKSTNKKLHYGQLVEAANQLEVPKEPNLKSPNDFKLIGKSLARPTVPLKVNGQANFGIDMKVEGMVYAVIERSPCFSGKVKSIDDTTAMQIKGVEQVIKCIRPVGIHNWEGVAVIANSYWAALKGRKALKIEWEEPDNLPSSESLHTAMLTKAKEDGIVDTEDKNYNKVFTNAPISISAQYETPFLAHAPMEPINTLAHVKEDSCEIWTAVQFPSWIRAEAAGLLEMKPEQITVHCPFMGGSFGRKGFPDFSLEGVLLSKAVGKPVKIVWTREDDIRQSPMRPGSLNRLEGALDEEGNLLAFQHKVIAPSFDHSLRGVDMSEKINPPWIMEPIGQPFYDSKAFSSRYVWVDATPVPLIWWRSVYSSTNVFGQESFIDELAHQAGIDPLEFRLSKLNKKQKYKRLLEFLAEKAGYDQPLPQGKARGIAITHCFESTCGQVIEVSQTEKGVKIDRVVTAIDCGITVNPDNVKAQCEGCVVMGLTAAIKDPIRIENGRVLTSNFHDYRVLRIHETPSIETYILPSAENPTGTGEPALPSVAPALANAIFNLTGQRIRTLPIDLSKIEMAKTIG